jgi:HD-GYP domain-containing protein (c-di-GMP phosphodiesterase class II)
MSVHADTRHDPVNAAELAAVDLLACLPVAARETLARQARHRHYRAGEVIFYEGDEGASLHLVRSGAVSVIRPSRDVDLVLQRLAAGDVFGEVAVLNSSRRLASVVASEDCETVEVFKADLDRVLEEHPAVMRRMLGLLANSLTLAKEEVAHHNQVLETRVRSRTEELRETQLETVRRLGQAAESRDDATGLHIARMSRFCQRLALAAGWSEADGELVLHATPMHDIGKIGVPDRILRKPGKLDSAEWEIMKSHTTIGASILAGSRSAVLKMAEAVAMHHHEKWDGTGYPAACKGEDIPLAARICAVCDVFDALVSERPYKHAWTVEAALSEIDYQSGKHFDPHLAALFVEVAPELVAEVGLR